MTPAAAEPCAGETPAEAAWTWPPWHLWLAAALVGVLRALPYLKARGLAGDDPPAVVPAGYNPVDWVQYASLIRQPPTHGGLTLANPYTTDPQDGRFILLYHQLLGLVHRGTGIDPFLLIELSRLVLLPAFLVALWWFAGKLAGSARERAWCCWLVLLSGGLQVLVVPLAPALPPAVAASIGAQLSTWHGWSTFEAMYNPLALAGLTLLLPLVALAADPEVRGGWRARLAVGAGVVVLWFLHPYSAIAFFAVLAATLSAEVLFARETAWRRVRWLAPALVPAGALVAVVLAWQLADPVYRATSGGAIGTFVITPFWYPVALGATGAFALLGWRRWLAEGRAWRLALGGWTAGILLLHSSDVLNGYHYLPYLHLSVALVAASAVADAFAAARRRGLALAGAALGLVALFASPGYVTLRDLANAGSGRLPDAVRAIVWALRDAPPGNVLAAADVGVVLPGFTDQRVFVGHWFMTPDRDGRAALVDDLLARPRERAPALRALVEEQRIDTLVVPMAVAEQVRGVLGGRAAVEPHGPLALVRIARP